MFNMKKMKKILAFCLCAMLMTTVPTFTETASAATTPVIIPFAFSLTPFSVMTVGSNVDALSVP